MKEYYWSEDELDAADTVAISSEHLAEISASEGVEVVREAAEQKITSLVRNDLHIFEQETYNQQQIALEAAQLIIKRMSLLPDSFPHETITQAENDFSDITFAGIALFVVCSFRRSLNVPTINTAINSPFNTRSGRSARLRPDHIDRAINVMYLSNPLVLANMTEAEITRLDAYKAANEAKRRLKRNRKHLASRNRQHEEREQSKARRSKSGIPQPNEQPDNKNNRRQEILLQRAKSVSKTYNEFIPELSVNEIKRIGAKNVLRVLQLGGKDALGEKIEIGLTKPEARHMIEVMYALQQSEEPGEVLGNMVKCSKKAKKLAITLKEQTDIEGATTVLERAISSPSPTGLTATLHKLVRIQLKDEPANFASSALRSLHSALTSV